MKNKSISFVHFLFLIQIVEIDQRLSDIQTKLPSNNELKQRQDHFIGN